MIVAFSQMAVNIDVKRSGVVLCIFFKIYALISTNKNSARVIIVARTKQVLQNFRRFHFFGYYEMSQQKFRNKQ